LEGIGTLLDSSEQLERSATRTKLRDKMQIIATILALSVEGALLVGLIVALSHF
jgi:hypothetical protein